MPATRHHRDLTLDAALRAWGVRMNDDEGRAARRLFKTATEFEDYMNSILYMSNSQKTLRLPLREGDYWGWHTTHFDSAIRATRSEVGTMLRIAASFRAQRDQLNRLAFYVAACLSHGLSLRAGTTYGFAPAPAYVSRDAEWEKMQSHGDYFDTVLAGFSHIDFSILYYVNRRAQKSFDPVYLRTVADDREHNAFTMLFPGWQLDSIYKAGVPAEYARDLRLAERTFSLDPQDVITLYRSGVPIEYVTDCIKSGIYPHSILQFWESGVPVEYAALV